MYIINSKILVAGRASSFMVPPEFPYVSLDLPRARARDSSACPAYGNGVGNMPNDAARVRKTIAVPSFRKVQPFPAGGKGKHRRRIFLLAQPTKPTFAALVANYPRGNNPKSCCSQFASARSREHRSVQNETIHSAKCERSSLPVLNSISPFLSPCFPPCNSGKNGRSVSHAEAAIPAKRRWTSPSMCPGITILFRCKKNF